MAGSDVLQLPEQLSLRYDAQLAVSVGHSRYETDWKNRRMPWSQLAARLSRSQQTGETHAEYVKMPKERQDRIKDIGGFVGGHLRGGKRRTGSVENRQVVTLDVDNAPADFRQRLEELITLGELPDTAYVIYSTHKHTADRPRLRLIVPMARPCTADQYEPLSRKLAEKLGMDYFDDSTYQATRLMYWPSHSCDVDPVFVLHDAPLLDPDAVLAEYPDWTDASYWPESSRAPASRKREAKQQGDPLEKTGIVGAFCRTYDIPEAIRTFLPDVYTPTDKPDRYTYTAGSTAAGLVLYEDGRFAYSNHGTDPAGGQLCNAFDLVRIHKFGHLDKDPESKSGKDLESYKEMAEFAAADPKVRTEVTQAAAEDFAAPEEGNWREQLRINTRGEVVADSWNAELILTHDEHLQGIRYNEMSRRITAEGVPWERPADPWRDADDAQLYQWLVRTYRVQFPREKFSIALTAVADRRRFHPVREYLDSLPAWDGEKRLDTLLIRCLGAEDNIFVREACRKALVAAVARVYEPGVKFDCVLVPIGPQGCGKSYLFSLLGGPWYSDNLTLTDMRDGKAAAEKLQGYWIIELGEMTGMRKTEVEAVKSFITRRDDIYRAAYGRNTESRKRQCIIVGTTNDDTGFLRDTTGNRRFWPIRVSGRGEIHPWDLTEDEIRQIWAEALALYRAGESLLLSPAAMQLAEQAQIEAMETDERQGIVEAYLERKLPKGWDSLDQDQRLLFLDSGDEGTEERTTVSNLEIWVEALHNPAKAMELKDTRAISAMMAKIPGWDKTGDRVWIPSYGRQRIYRKHGTVDRTDKNLTDF